MKRFFVGILANFNCSINLFLQMAPQIPGTMQHHTNTVRGMPTSAQNQLQHKRSLSFNHHLNYNQYQMQQQQQQLQHTTQQPQSLQGNVSSSFNSTYQPFQTPPARPSHSTPFQQTLRGAAGRTTPPVGSQKGNESGSGVVKHKSSFGPSFQLTGASRSLSQLPPFARVSSTTRSRAAAV